MPTGGTGLPLRIAGFSTVATFAPGILPPGHGRGLFRGPPPGQFVTPDSCWAAGLKRRTRAGGAGDPPNWQACRCARRVCGRDGVMAGGRDCRSGHRRTRSKLRPGCPRNLRMREIIEGRSDIDESMVPRRASARHAWDGRTGHRRHVNGAGALMIRARDGQGYGCCHRSWPLLPIAQAQKTPTVASGPR